MVWLLLTSLPRARSSLCSPRGSGPGSPRRPSGGFRHRVETGLCAPAGGVGSHSEERFRNPVRGLLECVRHLRGESLGRAPGPDAPGPGDLRFLQRSGAAVEGLLGGGAGGGGGAGAGSTQVEEVFVRLCSPSPLLQTPCCFSCRCLSVPICNVGTARGRRSVLLPCTSPTLGGSACALGEDCYKSVPQAL